MRKGNFTRMAKLLDKIKTAFMDDPYFNKNSAAATPQKDAVNDSTAVVETASSTAELPLVSVTADNADNNSAQNGAPVFSAPPKPDFSPFKKQPQAEQVSATEPEIAQPQADVKEKSLGRFSFSSRRNAAAAKDTSAAPTASDAPLESAAAKTVKSDRVENPADAGATAVLPAGEKSGAFSSDKHKDSAAAVKPQQNTEDAAAKLAETASDTAVAAEPVAAAVSDTVKKGGLFSFLKHKDNAAAKESQQPISDGAKKATLPADTTAAKPEADAAKPEADAAEKNAAVLDTPVTAKPAVAEPAAKPFAFGKSASPAGEKTAAAPAVTASQPDAVTSNTALGSRSFSFKTAAAAPTENAAAAAAQPSSSAEFAEQMQGALSGLFKKKDKTAPKATAADKKAAVTQTVQEFGSAVKSIPGRFVSSYAGGVSRGAYEENGIYNATRELGFGRTLALGIQQTIAMLGLVCVTSVMTGFNPAVAMFCAGVCTLIFQFVTKFKVPVFLSTSFIFVGAYSAIVTWCNSWLSVAKSPMPYVTGGLLVGGIMFIALSIFVWAFGLNKVMRFFPPCVMGPLIIVVGASLFPTAIARASENWLIAIFSIALMLVCNLFFKGYRKLLSLSIALVGGYAFSLIIGAVRFRKVLRASLFDIPNFFLPKFEVNAIVVAVIVAVFAVFPHLADMATASTIAKRDYLDDPGIARTMMGNGIGIALSALIGGPAQTTNAANVSLVASSGVFDPIVSIIAAAICIALSFLGKISVAIGTVPLALVGGLGLVLGSEVCIAGLRCVSNGVDLHSNRETTIAAAVLACGIGFEVSPLVIPLFESQLTLGGITIASIVGLLLNVVLPGGKPILKEPERENSPEV